MLVGALHPHGILCHVVKLPVTLRDETQRIGGVHECPIHTLNLFVEHVDNVAHAKICPPKFQPNKKFMWTRQKEERPQRLRNVVFFSRGCRHATRRPSVGRFTTADCFRHRFCFRTHPQPARAPICTRWIATHPKSLVHYSHGRPWHAGISARGMCTNEWNGRMFHGAHIFSQIR